MKHILCSCLFLLSITVQAQKKPLDHTVYDQWQSIKDVVLSNDGNWMSYTVAPQEGDATLYVRHLKTNQIIQIERGTQSRFTENNAYLIAKIKPSFEETRKAKIGKKKPEEMPKDSLVILTLTNGNVKRIPAVKSYQVPEFGSDVIAYLNDPKMDIKKEGAQLYFRDLNTGQERVFNNISEYAIHPKGEGVMMYQVKTKLNEAKILLASIADTNLKTINSRFYTATNFTWDKEGKQLAYLIEKDSTDKALQKNYVLAYYKHEMDSAQFVFNKTAVVMPNQYTIGGDKKLSFSKTGSLLSFGVQPILPVKDTSLPEFDRVSLDIWNYNESLLQSTQLKSLETSLKGTEAIIYRPASSQFTYLGKINDRQIQMTMEGDGQVAIANIDSNFTISSQWEGYGKRDLYILNTMTGQKQLIQTSRKVLGGSPTVENLAAAQDLQDIAPLASGNVTGFLSNLAGRGVSRAGGIRPSVAEELQKRLFTTNPQEQYSILRDIEEARRRQGSLLRQPGTYGIVGGEIPGLLNNEMTTIDIPI